MREVVNLAEGLVLRLEFDPWGRRSASFVFEDDDWSDFGYTGHHQHLRSGQALALYRAYSAELGRWLNRDPIGEHGGINLYLYVSNRPIEKTDLLGLFEFYGKWGGPDWIGGQKTALEDLTEAEKANLAPPIDSLDELFKIHDNCFSDCRVKCHTTKRDTPSKEDKHANSDCNVGCNKTLCDDMKKLDGDPSKWNKPAPDSQAAQKAIVEAKIYFCSPIAQ